MAGWRGGWPILAGGFFGELGALMVLGMYLLGGIERDTGSLARRALLAVHVLLTLAALQILISAALADHPVLAMVVAGGHWIVYPFLVLALVKSFPRRGFAMVRVALTPLIWALLLALTRPVEGFSASALLEALGDHASALPYLTGPLVAMLLIFLKQRAAWKEDPRLPEPTWASMLVMGSFQALPVGVVLWQLGAGANLTFLAGLLLATVHMGLQISRAFETPREPPSARAADRASSVVVAWLVASMFAAVGFGTFWQGARPYLAEQEMAEWAQVEGVMLSSGLQSRRDSQGDHYNVVAVRYRYEVDGEVHEGNQLRYTEQRTSTYQGRRLVERYPEGEAVVVHHDPQDPARAVLDPKAVGFHHYLLMAVGGLVVMLSLLGALYATVGRRREQDPPAADAAPITRAAGPR